MSFDPCGMVMDLRSACYTCKIRPFHDSNLMVDIVWFYCAPGAKIFPGWHRFSSLYHENEKRDAYPGEVWAGRKFSHGRLPFPLGFEGQKFCGRKEFFVKGASIYDAPLARTFPGPLPTNCCWPGPIPSAIDSGLEIAADEMHFTAPYNTGVDNAKVILPDLAIDNHWQSFFLPPLPLPTPARVEKNFWWEESGTLSKWVKSQTIGPDFGFGNYWFIRQKWTKPNSQPWPVLKGRVRLGYPDQDLHGTPEIAVFYGAPFVLTLNPLPWVNWTKFEYPGPINYFGTEISVSFRTPVQWWQFMGFRVEFGDFPDEPLVHGYADSTLEIGCDADLVGFPSAALEIGSDATHMGPVDSGLEIGADSENSHPLADAGLEIQAEAVTYRVADSGLEIGAGDSRIRSAIFVSVPGTTNDVCLDCAECDDVFMYLAFPGAFEWQSNPVWLCGISSWWTLIRTDNGNGTFTWDLYLQNLVPILVDVVHYQALNVGPEIPDSLPWLETLLPSCNWAADAVLS